jgi:tRNA U54 and U55 pseudouridine synthase Pus10
LRLQEELEAVLLKEFRAEKATFIAAGREDRDVRMLGSGRPFVLELINARNHTPSRFASSHIYNLASVDTCNCHMLILPNLST